MAACRSSPRSVWPDPKAAGLSARHAAVKELLNDEHKLHRSAYAESYVDSKRDSHIHR